MPYIVKINSCTIYLDLHIVLQISSMFLYVNHFCFSKIVLNFSGDVKENLVPKASSSHNFSIYHRNLNSISEHNYIRLSLLRSFVSVHEFDSTSVSET